MSADNDRGKKGFSGLSDLASEIDGDDEATHSSKTSKAPPTPHTSSPTPKTPLYTESERPESPPPIENSSSGKRGGSPGRGWALGILTTVAFMIWIASNWGQSTKKQTYNSPPPSVTPSAGQGAGLQYEKPPVGTKKTLSIYQIRWCLREEIRIETMRDHIENNQALKDFNRIVNDFNLRCSSYSYRKGLLEQAKKEVEAERNHIEFMALQDVGKLGHDYQPTPLAASAVKNVNTQDEIVWDDLEKEYQKEQSALKNEIFYQEQPLPKSGDVQSSTKAKRVAPFKIEAGEGGHYLVKLVDAKTSKKVMTVFVRSGTTIKVSVPLGSYEIRYASGETWYGYEHLFGQNTVYSKADELFTFEVIGNQISGFTITLYKVTDGNLSTSSIKPADF